MCNAKKCENEFTLLDDPRANYTRNVRSAYHIEAARRSVRDDRLSVRRCSHLLKHLHQLGGLGEGI